MTFNIDTRTVTLVDKVEASILEYIKGNSLKPGSSLPNEQELSSELGISRNVLREALSRLRMLGIIQTRTKRGIVIQEPSLLTGFEKVVEPYLLSDHSIAELVGVRLIIETGLVDFLFDHLTDDLVEELERIVALEAKNAYPLTVEQEMAFHRKIYEITGNGFLVDFQRIIYPVFIMAKNNYEEKFAPLNDRLSLEGQLVTHQHLLGYLKSGDRDGYRRAIKQHLSIYEEFIRNLAD